MNTYKFKQLGTYYKITVEADSLNEAKKLASSKLSCRKSSCIYLDPDGTISVFTLTNLITRQRIKIKSDNSQSAKEEMAIATNTEFNDWNIDNNEIVEENSVNDIQYETNILD